MDASLSVDAIAHALREAVRGVVAAFADPARALFEPEKRVFWPHLLASAVVVAVVWARGPRRRSLLRAVADPALWLHRSARLDYVLFVARGVLRLTLFAPFAIAAVPLAASLARRLAETFGASPFAAVSPACALACFTATLFVVEDFSRFLFHLASHRWAWLWELHKVHHAAEVLTPFTLYRVHPIEGLLNRTRGVLTTALVAGACAWLFPGKVRGLEILGVDALGFLWSFAGANLRHSHVWIAYGPRVERWLLSPAQHQIHHSVRPEHHDRNFGTALAIWDRLFGTLHVTRGRERLAIGLRAGDWPHGDGLVAALACPIRASFVRMRERLVPRRTGRAGASVASRAA